MGQPQWARVKEIFQAVREAEEEAREPLLRELCGGNADVRARVEALLAAEAEGGDLLGSPTMAGLNVGALAAASLAAASQEEPGSRVGPYKLLQVIGEGGFGVVYMAEQERPIRRLVALKVVKPGMDTKQVVARFEAERQALAMLDHPNIATVFDAGTTPTGRPYFAMELVKGIPITAYCDEHTLDTRERLVLFADVCRAVQHAHEHGIIHRDLKPSNVMVTLHDGTPVPKIIDFGVAKATHQRLTETTLFTEYNQFIGTPTYMSPEQAAYEGLDVDARSDVYSLGVLLYELLTGTTPHDSQAMKRAAYLEILRILKEEEPPKPSTRVHTMGKASEVHAKHRSADPNALQKLLRGDLDWIVMKALEKDRRRRYGSASEMAADIARYFEQRPILARPPSVGYRARKFARRKRGPLAAAATVALFLLGDLTHGMWQGSQTADGVVVIGSQVTELLMTSDEHECFTDPEPSPDGSKVLYTDWCDRGGVYVFDTESGVTDVLAIEGYTVAALWSPDGTRILLGSTYDEQGGQPPRVYDLATAAVETPRALRGLFPHEWSRDGDRLSGTMNRDGIRSTVVVSLSSGEVTALAEGVRSGQAAATFSPDGRYVVFADLEDGSEDLFAADLETGQRWAVVTSPETEVEAIWAPDGGSIVYQTESGVWALALAEGRPVGEPRLVGRERHAARAWTEHGYYYAVDNSITRDQRIRVDPRTGRAEGGWEPFPLPGPDLSFVRLAWSPDMSRAAVGGCCDGLLHILEGSTTKAIPLGAGVTPATLWWSADGSEVLFITTGRDRDAVTETVFSVEPDAGTVRELFPGLHADAVAHINVSPDGASMVSIQPKDVSVQPEDGVWWSRLVISDVGEISGRVLAVRNEHGAFSGVFGQPLFSPDGSRVLFHRVVRDGLDRGVTLWVIDADGTGETLLGSASGTMSPGPSWDPTGRLVAFQVREEDGPHLRIVSVEDGATHELDGLDAFNDPWLLNWSADGSWISLAESVGRGELWLTRDVLGDGSR